MATELAYTLHTVTSGGERYAAKQVVELDVNDIKDFLKLKAVREPTAEEIELYELGQGKKPKAAPAAATKAAKAKPAKAVKAAKAEPAPAPAPVEDAPAPAEAEPAPANDDEDLVG